MSLHALIGSGPNMVDAASASAAAEWQSGLDDGERAISEVQATLQRARAEVPWDASVAYVDAVLRHAARCLVVLEAMAVDLLRESHRARCTLASPRARVFRAGTEWLLNLLRALGELLACAIAERPLDEYAVEQRQLVIAYELRTSVLLAVDDARSDAVTRLGEDPAACVELAELSDFESHAVALAATPHGASLRSSADLLATSLLPTMFNVPKLRLESAF